MFNDILWCVILASGWSIAMLLFLELIWPHEPAKRESCYQPISPARLYDQERDAA